MGILHISTENDETFSSISNNFIDYYMTDASGFFVKVYLYLVRSISSGNTVSVADIADHFNCTETDVCRAIRYWIAQNVLKFVYDEADTISGIIICSLKKPATKTSDANVIKFSASLESPATKTNSVPAAIEESNIKENAIPAKPTYTKRDIEDKLRDTRITDLQNIGEAYLARPFTQKDISSIIYMLDELKLDADLIEYLFEYCCENKKSATSYYEKVALNWYSEKITNRQEAKLYTTKFSKLLSGIFKNLGIPSRLLTATEKEYIDKWQKEYSFSDEMIIEACKRAMINKPAGVSFKYIDSMLSSWHSAGLKRIVDINQYELQRRATNKNKDTKVDYGSFHNYMAHDNKNELNEMVSFFINEVNND